MDKCCQPFVNLHVHTAYSLRDAVSMPKEVAEKVKRMGQPAVAITEHGNVFSSVKATKFCKENGIKHIYGCEFYIAPDRNKKDKDQKYYHMTVLAKNEQGRLNLNRLVSLSEEYFYHKPRIDFELLQEYGEGLIVLSGCMASEIQQALAGGKIGDNKNIIISSENYRKAKEIAARYKQAFGDDYYIEIQAHFDPAQQKLNQALVRIARELGIKIVATSDSHFLDEEDLALHSVFMGINRKNQDYFEKESVYKDCQLQSIDEARERLAPSLSPEDVEEAIATTMEIMEKCNTKIPLSAPLIPHVDVPETFELNGKTVKIKDEDHYLQMLCNRGWMEREINKKNEWVLVSPDGSHTRLFNSKTAKIKDIFADGLPSDLEIEGMELEYEFWNTGTQKELHDFTLQNQPLIEKGYKIVQFKEVYKARLQYEFNAISKMGFSGYYLLVESYANEVTRRGIARGSGGGSLVAYLMNIVDIDPVEFDLWFERFIDVGQLELLEKGVITRNELKIPDFDLDFGVDEREAIVARLVKDHGQDHVASLGNFGYMKDKLAIKDVGRSLQQTDYKGLTQKEINDMSRIVGEQVGDKAGEQLKHSLDDPQMKKYQKAYPKLFDYATRLLGLPRTYGSHPCGKVVTIDKVQYYTAISIDKKTGQYVLQCDMKDADALGLVKIDTLGLRTVDVIYDVLEMIGKDYRYINPAKQNWKDPKVLEIFRKGFTFGIFQFESDGMKNTLRKMNPSGLDDLGVANALYRPGAMKYIDNYIARKHGEEKFKYLNDDLKGILAITFAIMVFQEQLIAVGRMAGMRNPDLLRQATGKKNEELLRQVEPELREGLYKNGWTQDQVDQLWADMLDFAKYSFNKAHSYAYAIIAWLCAKLKAYHPTEFMIALFNSYRDSKVKQKKGGKKENRMEMCYKETQRMGSEFAQFSFNHPSVYCSLLDGKVNYGIALVKFCNEQIAKDLIALSKNKYDHFVDLVVDIKEKTSLDSRQLKILTSLNFFHMFGGNKKLLDFIERFEYRFKKTHKDKTKVVRIAELREFWDTLEDEELDLVTQVFKEKDFLGFCIHRQELELFEDDPKRKSNKYDAVILGIEKPTSGNIKVNLYFTVEGKEDTWKVKRREFFDSWDNDQLVAGDVISVLKAFREPKKMRTAEGKWVARDGEYEWFLQSVRMLTKGVRPEATEDESDKTEIVEDEE